MLLVCCFVLGVRISELFLYVLFILALGGSWFCFALCLEFVFWGYLGFILARRSQVGNAMSSNVLSRLLAVGLRRLGFGVGRDPWG